MPVGQLFSGIMGYDAGKQAAAVDEQTAQYNAKYDQAVAQQLQLDTLQNISNERQNDAVYLSKQAAGYASSGVLATSGSALHAQITNAGRFEQQIQQQYVNSQQKQAEYYSQASVGLLEGQAQAQADRLKGTIALINGATNAIGTGYSNYQGSGSILQSIF